LSIKRVLIADNDIDFLETRAEQLEVIGGYRVFKAASPEEAEQLLARTWLHLAIFDIRMRDDNDDLDVSGLTLAADDRFRPIPKIILTRHATVQLARDALVAGADGQPLAVDFVDKKDELETLLEAMESVLDLYVPINWDLSIRQDKEHHITFPYLVSLVEPDIDAASFSDLVYELEDLFRMLFYQKSELLLGRLFWHREGRTCLTVFAFFNDQPAEHYLVTCGSRYEIEQERTRYERFAPKFSRERVSEDFARTTHFAAAAHLLPRVDLERVQTLKELYSTHQTGQMRKALENLCETTLVHWHSEGASVEETKSLGQLYSQRLKLGLTEISRADFEHRMRTLVRKSLFLGPTRMELSSDGLVLRFPNDDTVSYPNPLARLHENVQEDDLAVRCCTTPGVPTGDTILLDQNGQTWLTDFGQAGYAPLLWDFVLLESFIRFELVTSDNLQALHEFEQRLNARIRLADRPDWQDLDQPFRDAVQILGEVRHLASSLTELMDDTKAYYEGLFYLAMKKVADFAPEVRHTRKNLARPIHALMAAAMLCSREQFVLSRGIKIDKARHQVWVDGREVDLSLRQFDLLSYLYENAGLLCDRRSIVEEGLKDVFMTGDQEDSRINTAIGRLRKKIGDDSDDPRYIITVRGRGYKLLLGDE
jgi:DNA-binding response OmpR family regulator